MLPKPLYERLPYLYFLAAFISFMTLETQYALVPIGSFVAAGLMVKLMRRQRRRQYSHS